ncbi:MAG: hypothetical protein AAGH89_12890 [Verrucomicrobiota bacterium]
MKPAISIDFGAAYTKVAIRRQPDTPSELLNHDSLDLDPLHVCIPTIAAWSASRDQWVFGADAADMRSSDDIYVFRNWKKALFESGDKIFDPESQVGSIFYQAPAIEGETDPKMKARTVGLKYFHWLKNELVPSMAGSGGVTEEAIMRICIPDFALNSLEASSFDDLLTDAGWKTLSSFCISEPLANLTGALSQGRNFMNQDDDGEPMPDVSQIFQGSDLINFINSFDASTMDEEPPSVYSVLIIDVGAYTADFGLVAIDLESLGYFPLCETNSEPLGISHLDEMVQNRLPDAKKQAIRKLSSMDLEKMRRSVYSEETAWEHPEVGKIGEADEAAIVQSCITELATEIGKSLDGFLNEHETTHIDEVILTGGGNNIPRLVDELGKQLSGKGAKTFHAANVKETIGSARAVPLNAEVVRGASAIGGASVLFGDI